MGHAAAPLGLVCPQCGKTLEPVGPGSRDGHRLICRGCGETFRARLRKERAPASPSANGEAHTVGSLGLAWRRLGLEAIELLYRGGTVGGASLMLALGGFVPVVRGWLRDEVASWSDVVDLLGGVWAVTRTHDPDADLGPVIVYGDAPVLFGAIAEVARRLGARPPQQVRLSYLPCCGVVAWRRSSALVIGMPLLYVLTMAELRAVLAHELAHLKRGDATSSARHARFVHALGQALDGVAAPSASPLRVWAELCRGGADRLLAPIARSQEVRADRLAASVAGGYPAASALVKVALVQPLFREVLERYDPTDPDLPNLYAFFREFWNRLPESLQSALRLQLLSSQQPNGDSEHPPLPDRLTAVQAYPHKAAADSAPAKTALSDLEALEQMLHNRLFSTPGVEPSVFHRAGT